MQRPAWVGVAAWGTLMLLATAARAQDTAPNLTASDFTLTLADSTGNVLASDQLATYFSRARCACPTTLTARLDISSDAAATLGAHAVDAQLMIGNDCDNATASACAAVGGALALAADSASVSTSVTTSKVFDAATG